MLNDLYHLGFEANKTSLPAIYFNPIDGSNQDYVRDDILGMEIDPRESRWYVYNADFSDLLILKFIYIGWFKVVENKLCR